MSSSLTMTFILGLLFGIALVNLFNSLKNTSGILKIDTTNPNKDVYRLELDSIDNLNKKKKIILKVDSHADLSQK